MYNKVSIEIDNVGRFFTELFGSLVYFLTNGNVVLTYTKLTCDMIERYSPRFIIGCFTTALNLLRYQNIIRGDITSFYDEILDRFVDLLPYDSDVFIKHEKVGLCIYVGLCNKYFYRIESLPDGLHYFVSISYEDFIDRFKHI